LFSVVIPLYNKESTIAATIKSVLQQDYSHFEVVIVDDGSTDNSLQLASKFTDNRISIYKRAHKGVSAARNYAVSKSKFDFIAFLDADDSWEPNYLREMLCLICKYPNCALFGSAYKVIKRNCVETIGDNIKEGTIANYFRERLQHRIMRTSATIVKKVVLKRVGGFPVGMVGGEDEYTWTKIALRNSLAFTPKILATYNLIHSSSLWRNGQPDNCKESWFDFYKPGELYRNEFIAQKAIIAGIRYALGSSKEKSLEIERKTQFSKLSKSSWRYLYLLNRHPFIVAQILYRLSKNYLLIRSYFKMNAEIKNENVSKFELSQNVDAVLINITFFILLISEIVTKGIKTV